MIILFDLSGVFFNKGLKVAVERISMQYKLDPEKVRFVLNGEFAEEYRTGKIEVEAFWQQAAKELGVDDIQGVRQLFFDAYEPQKETVELIKKLREKKITVAYLSNNPKDRAFYLDQKYGFLAHFDFGLFSFQARVRKPQKEIYEKFLAGYELDAQEIIYTDDKEGNLIPAKELGMKTIHFESVEQFSEELKKIEII